MAANPNARKLKEVLTGLADSLLDRIAAAEPIADIAKDVGIYPAQIQRFFLSIPDLRERYRAALESAQALEAEVNIKATAKVKKAKGYKTQMEIAAMFEQEILDRLENGELVREVAAGYQIDHAVISRYFRSTEPLKAKYTQALEDGGHSLAERSVQAANGIALDLTEAKMAELRSNRLAWLASKRNSMYDQRQQIKLDGNMVHSVSIDIQA